MYTGASTGTTGAQCCGAGPILTRIQQKSPALALQRTARTYNYFPVPVPYALTMNSHNKS